MQTLVFPPLEILTPGKVFTTFIVRPCISIQQIPVLQCGNPVCLLPSPWQKPPRFPSLPPPFGKATVTRGPALHHGCACSFAAVPLLFPEMLSAEKDTLFVCLPAAEPAAKKRAPERERWLALTAPSPGG